MGWAPRTASWIAETSVTAAVIASASVGGGVCGGGGVGLGSAPRIVRSAARLGTVPAGRRGSSAALCCTASAYALLPAEVSITTGVFGLAMAQPVPLGMRPSNSA